MQSEALRHKSNAILCPLEGTFRGCNPVSHNEYTHQILKRSSTPSLVLPQGRRSNNYCLKSRSRGNGHTIFGVVAVLLLLTGLVAPRASAQDAKEIVQKADQKVRGESSEASMTMKIERPTWSRTVDMKAWSKGTEYSMILVTDPPRDKGTAFLKRKTEIWNWVPSISRVVKLPPSMMMQSWMGSDFKNDDLVKESSMVTDYTHSLIGDSTIAGYKCYKIKMIPKPDAAVVWGKVLIWITQKEYMELRVEFFDEDGNLVNTMNASDIKDLGGRELPARMEMIPSDKPGNKTILMYHSLTFNKPIPLSFFSTQNMKRLQ